jgi:hypothetical protein
MLSPAAHKLLYAKKKELLVERHATHAQLLGHWRNGGLSKRLWVDQIGDTQQRPDQDNTGDASTPQTSCSGDFQRCGSQCAYGHYHATLRHLSALALGVWLE